MLVISGYEIIETIYEGTRTIVYRGKSLENQQSVVIKVLKENYANLEQSARLRHEHTILQKLNCEGIVKPCGLEKHQNSCALILEDFGGQSLKQVLTCTQLQLRDALQITIALAESLIALHKVPIIHKDIKPSNIIINTETRKVKITDFSIASCLELENQKISNPNLLEGTLAYMSPEQTGRMNRTVDYRSDFYSLGITFYEMLTGSVPFTTTDPMELVHCHIAKQPAPLPGEIPEVISAIVTRLLAKNAEDRYQSATGLKFDLETSLLQLQTTGTIEDFPLGRRDRGSQLLIPQKLYGREGEVQSLMETFGRVCLGRSEMMLVSGYSGIGKTSIVNEIHKLIIAARGYFISGKFDQFTQNIPYSALIQAFQELIRQLLTEDRERVAIWKANLLNALGQNGQIIIDVIPEVELIIGRQPEVAQVGTSESQNRFNRIFKQFISVFCQAEHPLVLFSDDLQWADRASLKLIQLLVTDSDIEYLFVIGAYRDREVNQTHPLIQTLEKIKESGIEVNQIAVGPLSSDRVSQLVGDTLNESIAAERIELLTELIFNKTQGNPFFLTQILKTLYSENLLIYEIDTDSWQWDIEQIQAVGIIDYNVIELITKNIHKLPLSTQKVLKMAACLGNQFNLNVLAIVNEESEVVTATQLWSALHSGLILPLSASYKIPLLFGAESVNYEASDIKVDYRFLHDRVQQAVYSLIPQFERKATHLRIGELLLISTTPEEQKDNIFTLINQLNFGIDLLTVQSKKDNLAKLNLIAGQKAKIATAYEAAVNCLNVGLGLLASNSWQEQYQLTLTFYFEIAEAEYLNTNLERAINLCNLALEKTTTTLDAVNFYEIKVKISLAQSQIDLALSTGLKALEMLEIPLSESPPSGLIVEELANLPQMTDPYKLAAMKLLILIYAPACFGETTIALPILYTMIQLSRLYGNSPPSIYAYAVHGVITAWLVPDIDLGYKLGQLAWQILDKLNAQEFYSKASVSISINITYKKQHIRETIEPLYQAIQCGLEFGDIEFACHAANFYCEHLFFVGEQLESVARKQATYIELISKFEQEHPLYLTKIGGQMVANLIAPSAEKCSLIGEIFNEEKLLPHFLRMNNLISIFNVYFYKSMLCYLFKDYKNSLENAKSALNYSGFIQSEIIFTKHNLYYSLALLAQYPNGFHALRDESEQQDLDRVVENQKKMKYWADHAPMNFCHLYDLVEAEKARVLGQTLEAMEYYDRAIAGAKRQGYIQEEALACELAAEFYLFLLREEIAKMYMTKAYNSYVGWGAMTKVKDLESRYPQFFSSNKVAPTRIKEITPLSTTTSSPNILDFTTVVKASQTLASEILQSQLLKKLMKIMLENAGAQKGFLVLEREGKWLIEAEGEVDNDDFAILQSLPVNYLGAERQIHLLPTSIVNYVARTNENVVLNDATYEGRFRRDSYIVTTQPKSILCTPLLHQGKIIGILYLENNLTTDAFTPERVAVLKILSSQAAISINNSRLYEQLEDYNRTLEQKVEVRTRELKEKNEELGTTLQKLKTTQAQIVAQEKLASLGALTAGIAHEIKNPLNFVNNFAELSVELTQELLEQIEIQKEKLNSDTREYIEEILNDLSQNAKKINEHGKRADNIVRGMLMHSRGQTGERQLTNINTLLSDSFNLAYHGMRAKNPAFNITLKTNYDYNLAQVNVVAQDISRVFLNIFNNACYTTFEKKKELGDGFLPTLLVSTKNLCDEIEVRIQDNGKGIAKEILDKIFHPFFTTKATTQGTGLGLSISHDIIVQHQGKIEVETELGSHTELIVILPKTVMECN